jgi:methionine-rich copper-binding protein CopC
MLKVSYTSTGGSSYRADLLLSADQTSGSYDNYSVLVKFDPTKGSIVLPSPQNSSGFYGLGSTFALQPYINVSDLGAGTLRVLGISLSPVSASTKIGSFSFTGVKDDFSIFLDDMFVGLDADAIIDTTVGVTYYLDGSWLSESGNSSAGPAGSIVQPSVAPDTSPPAIVSTSPANTSSIDPTTALIVLNYSEALVKGTGTVELRSTGGALIESFDLATSNRVFVSGSTLTLDPTDNFSGSSSYSVVIPMGAVKDAAGNATTGSFTFNFTTTAAGVDATAPTVNEITPAVASQLVATTSNITIQFNEAIEIGSGEIQLLTSGGSLVETFSTGSSALSVVGDTLTINPSNELSTATSYRLTFTGAAVQDLAGNPFIGLPDYSFTTANLSAAALTVTADRASVDEAGTVVFRISAPSLAAGNAVQWSLSGVSLKDLTGGQLTGSAILGQGKTAQVAITPLADGRYEGPETLIFSAEGVQASTIINDTSMGSNLAQSIAITSTSGGTFMLSQGPDVLTGGPGRDIAFVNDVSQNYSITTRYGKTVLAENSTLNQDTLSNVERIQFSDKTVALDIDAVPGQAYRIYKAVFDREPDLEGIGFWINRLEAGMDLIELSARFIDSPEFDDRYGDNPSNADYLMKLYNNVLGRIPDSNGYNWWLDQLNTNPEKTREKVLADFSESIENKDGVAELIASGIDYIPWVLG